MVLFYPPKYELYSFNQLVAFIKNNADASLVSET